MKDAAKTIEQNIFAAIQDSCGVSLQDADMHLLSNRSGIPLPDFLYVIDALERVYGYPVSAILAEQDYTVFTIHNLAQQIYNKAVT